LREHLSKNSSLSFVRGSTEKDSLDTIQLSEKSFDKLSKFFTSSNNDEKIVAKEVVEVSSGGEGISTVENNIEEGIVVEAVIPEITDIDGFVKKVLSEMIPTLISYDSFNDELPGEVVVSEISKYPAVLDFEKIFEVNFLDVVKEGGRSIPREEERLSNEASDNLNGYWKQKLDENSKYNFRVKINNREPVETSMIQFLIDQDDGEPLYMEHKSKGFRWFSAFNLRLRASGVKKNELSKLLIMIDEPGQGLHEKAQRNAKLILEELASKGAQIVYSTHHPNLIGIEAGEFARIRLVTNTKKSGTKVMTVSQFASKIRKGAKDTLSPIITAMGMHSVQTLIDAKRLNVVVEGISDHYYLSAFKKLLAKDDNLYFLPSCGASNVPNLVSILVGWGFRYKAIFDDDPGSGRKCYNLLKKEFYEKNDALAHQHILKLKEKNGIEDIFDPKDFYKFVLNESYPTTGLKILNSKLAEDKKELYARIFLEKVENGDVSLSGNSIKNINEIFDWLYDKFSISASD